MGDEFLSLFGGALSEPVVSEQSSHLVGVHQLPRHEGQRAKRHLFTAGGGGVKGHDRRGDIHTHSKRQSGGGRGKLVEVVDEPDFLSASVC